MKILKHPVTLPLLFSLLFSALFSLLFVALLNQEEKKAQEPALLSQCLNELRKPFMVEKEATKITCARDGKGFIIYYDYKESDREGEWMGTEASVSFYPKETGEGLYLCAEKRCLLATFKGDESKGVILAKPADF